VVVVVRGGGACDVQPIIGCQTASSKLEGRVNRLQVLLGDDTNSLVIMITVCGGAGVKACQGVSGDSDTLHPK
jgi:hypothetical protein